MSELHTHVEEGLARYLGLVPAEPDAAGDGIRAVYEARLEQTHTNGTVVQGGVVSAWLDNAMALAVIAVDPKLQFASIDLQVAFMRVTEGRREPRPRAHRRAGTFGPLPRSRAPQPRGKARRPRDLGCEEAGRANAFRGSVTRNP